MINIDDKIYRNLEEQVGKNKDDIEALKFGLNIVGTVPEYTELPEAGSLGDAYVVGPKPPFYIYVRVGLKPKDYINLGTLASTVAGPKGADGAKGEPGVGIESMIIDSMGVLIVTYTDGTEKRLTTLRGPQGRPGIMGPQGPKGEPGEIGPQGKEGPIGASFHVVGRYDNISHAPSPLLINDPTAAVIIGSGEGNYTLYIQNGTTPENRYWMPAGKINNLGITRSSVEVPYNKITYPDYNQECYMRRIAEFPKDQFPTTDKIRLLLTMDGGGALPLELEKTPFGIYIGYQFNSETEGTGDLNSPIKKSQLLFFQFGEGETVGEATYGNLRISNVKVLPNTDTFDATGYTFDCDKLNPLEDVDFTESYYTTYRNIGSCTNGPSAESKGQLELKILDNNSFEQIFYTVGSDEDKVFKRTFINGAYSEWEPLGREYIAGKGIKIENDTISLEEDLGKLLPLVVGGLDSSGLENNYNTRLRSLWIPTEGKTTLKLNFKNFLNEEGYRIGASYYKDNTPETKRFASSGWQKPIKNTIELFLPEETQYFRLLIAHAKDSPIKTSDFEAYYSLIESTPQYNVFTVGSDLIKRKNIMMTQFGGGRIKGLQSFCIYNNKFYSTDGKNKIYVQDKKTYTLEKTVDLAIGHGNSFQLGNSHFAYISGWDDNKLYKIDLNTITIASTYTLPTTGFTNALYDENRDLIYIFQRDTQPGSAEEAYKFIVYDPIKSQTISTTKTGIKFGAMQASDLYDDKIIVCAGLGLNHKTVPNKYMIFDTTGHLLTRIYIPIKENEPEGIAIDHTDGKMYMSFIDQIVYTLSV